MMHKPFVKTFLLLFLISKCEAFPGHVGYASGPKCYKEVEVKCVDVPKKEKHVKCELILDITYTEECDHSKLVHCDEETVKVHSTSDNTLVVSKNTDHNKDCINNINKECHLVPKEEVNKVCKTIVSTVYVEECHDIIHPFCDCGNIPLDVCYKHI